MVELLLLFIGVTAGLLLKDYLPTYAATKGKNLATKEDIEEITTKIETVRSEVTLKKELQKQHFDTAQQYLMAFYDNVTVFFYERLAANFGDFPSDRGESLYNYQQRFYSDVAEIMKSYQRLVIFLSSDSELLETAARLAQKAADTRKVLKDNFWRIKVTLIEEQSTYVEDDRDAYEAAVKKADEANSAFWKQMRPEVEEFRAHYQQLLKQMNSYVSLDTGEV